MIQQLLGVIGVAFVVAIIGVLVYGIATGRLPRSSL